VKADRASSEFVVVMSVDLIKRVDGPMLHVIVSSTPTQGKDVITIHHQSVTHCLQETAGRKLATCCIT